MLLLKQPTKSEFDFKHPHEYSPPGHYSSKFSPKVTGGIFRTLSASDHNDRSHTMSTQHRGLPPPAGMTLPDPGRGPPPPLPPQSSQAPQPLGHMPAPPAQWQGAEESMKNWLVAKAEEDRRKQEEERTKQESLKLEQRKIEQQILQDSIRNGVPPHLVPMIFAGIGGVGILHSSPELMQQYMAQLSSIQQIQQQQATQMQVSPDSRRETRLINPAQGGYNVAGPGQQQALLPAPVIPSQATSAVQPAPPHGAFPSSQYSGGAQTQSPLSRPRASTVSGGGQTGSLPSSRGLGAGALPRLSTDTMNIQPPPGAPGTVHGLQQQAQQEQTSSPSISFHHWVPPTSQGGSGASRDPPATPSDHPPSPKKRKAQGAHQPAPPPSSVPQYNSPSFSQGSSTASTPARRAHARTRSDTTARAHDIHGRPASRHGARHMYHPEVALTEETKETRRGSGASAGRGNTPHRATPVQQQYAETRSQHHAPTSGPPSPKREMPR